MSKTDEEILKDVFSELRWNPSIDADHIGVSVSKGVVTLTGHVPSYFQRWEAQRVVERVAGVRAVAEELEVKLPEESERDNVSLARAAAEALKWNSSVPEGVKAIVDDGWITLKGEVVWGYQRSAAERAVQSLWGVKGILNEIVVKPKVGLGDVKKKIEEALRRVAAQDAKEIDVKVEGSKVILKGRVHSFEEYRAARDAAWSAPWSKGGRSRFEDCSLT